MYNSINGIELGLACIVCIGYIVGKVWVYHNHTKESNSIENRNKRMHRGVIKRGKEWD